jgi:hypothetical protein
LINRNQSGLPYWFLDEAIFTVLERELSLNPGAFHRVALDTEAWLEVEGIADDKLQAQLTALRHDLDAAWQQPLDLTGAIEEVSVQPEQ